METQIERRPMYNSTSGDKFRYNGHTPKIAVIGIRDSQNQFTRAVEGYGFQASHCNPDERIPIDADAAICVTSFISHSKFYEAKEEFKRQGKKVFFASDGFSEIKNEFELYFFSDLKKMLDGLVWNMRFYYLMAYFNKTPGTWFKYRELLYKVRRYYPDATEVHANNFFVAAIKSGSVERKEGGRGRYTFLGIDSKTVSRFKEKHGIIIDSGWIRPQPVDVPTPMKAQEPTPEPLAKPVQVAPEVKAESKIPQEITLELIFVALSEIEKSISGINQRLDRIFK